MLEQIFSSRTRVKLLRLFLINPQKSYYIREITRLIDERINSVRRELKNLEKLGMVVPEIKKQKKYYTNNSDFILYPELRSLILKAQVTLEKDLVSAIRKIGSIAYMVLTGLFVGLKDTQVDILIVGKVNRRKLKRLMSKFQKNLGREINYTVMSKQEFQYRRDITDRFLYNILENKKIVIVDKLNKR